MIIDELIKNDNMANKCTLYNGHTSEVIGLSKVIGNVLLLMACCRGHEVISGLPPRSRKEKFKIMELDKVNVFGDIYSHSIKNSVQTFSMNVTTGRVDLNVSKNYNIPNECTLVGYSLDPTGRYIIGITRADDFCEVGIFDYLNSELIKINSDESIDAPILNARWVKPATLLVRNEREEKDREI